MPSRAHCASCHDVDFGWVELFLLHYFREVKFLIWKTGLQHPYRWVLDTEGMNDRNCS